MRGRPSADIALAPNRDGVNVEVGIGFALYRVQVERWLTIEIYALSSQRVRRIEGMATGEEQDFSATAKTREVR